LVKTINIWHKKPVGGVKVATTDTEFSGSGMVNDDYYVEFKRISAGELDVRYVIIAFFLLAEQTRPVSPAAGTDAEVFLLGVFEKLAVGAAGQERGVAVESQSGGAGGGGDVVELLLRAAGLEWR
jgi:hypothetical protein